MDAAAAVGAHHDHPGVRLPGRVDDLGVGAPEGRGGFPDRNIGIAEQAAHFLEARGRSAFVLRVDEDVDRLAQPARDVYGEARGQLRPGGAVEGEQHRAAQLGAAGHHDRRLGGFAEDTVHDRPDQFRARSRVIAVAAQDQ